MGAHVGFAVHGINIAITHGGLGHRGEAAITLIDQVTTLDEAKSYVQRRIKVLFAGAFAESIGPDGKVDSGLAWKELDTGGGATDDFSKIRELLRILRSASYPPPKDNNEHEKQLKALQDPLWNESGEYVEQASQLIQSVAEDIANKFRDLDRFFGMSEQELRGRTDIRAWLNKTP